MKRSVFRLLAVIAVVGFAASCGGGGDDDKSFNFAGQWAWSAVYTASNVPGIVVGERLADVMTITQNGNAVTVTFPPDEGTSIVMTGTCDPAARTFSASGLTTGSMPGIRMTVQGTGVDDDSMSGTFSQQLNNLIASGTWTADLVSRSAAFIGPSGEPGVLRGSSRFSR